jgi:hypothetical protein
MEAETSVSASSPPQVFFASFVAFVTKKIFKTETRGHGDARRKTYCLATKGTKTTKQKRDRSIGRRASV